MPSLEHSVAQLASSLDALEARLRDRLHDLAAADDASRAARREAAAAGEKAREAADEIAGAVRDLKALIAETKGG